MPIRVLKIIFFITTLVVSHPHVYAQKSAVPKGTSCSSYAGSFELHWISIQNVKALRLPAKMGSAKLPSDFKVFTVNNARLKKYMSALKARPGNLFLPVPVNPGCLQVNVSNSGTMSAELAAKFPELVSLKGNGVTQKASTVRLDYDGKVLNAEITHEGTIYIIAPWKKGTAIYYLLYRKQDSGVERKPLSEK